MARIRSALGRPAAAPETLPPFEPTPEGEHEPGGAADLVGQFSRELVRVGGRISHARTPGEVRELLRGIYPAEEFPTVAVSNGEELGRLGVREWLASEGRRVVPSLEESMADGTPRATHAGQDSPPAREGTTPDGYKRLLLDAGLGITCADYALADTGTLALVSGGEQHRLISLLPPAHVCLLDPRRIFTSLTDLLAHVQAAHDAGGPLPRALTCITGPSRTADIELTVTTGVHGPRDLHVILYAPAGIG